MAWTYPRVAVVPTNARPCFFDAAAALLPQVDHLVVVQNGGDLITPADDKTVVVLDPRKPLNISRWWNQGLEWARRYAIERGAQFWDVAVVNDDVIVPPDWFDKLSETLHRTNVAVVSFGSVTMPVLHSKQGPMDLMSRPQGFAWMTAGQKGIRADEDLVWWCGDDDIWLQATTLGGAMVIPGNLQHLFPNGQMTPELHEQAGKDMNTYIAKHGFRPW